MNFRWSGSPILTGNLILVHRKVKPRIVFFFIILCVRGGKTENISQAKRVVVVSGESIRVSRIVRIEGELFAGEF